VTRLTAEDVLVLYDRHARGLIGFFARRTGDPQLALDLLGETFVAVFEARESCRAIDDRQRAAWLYRIAANQLADWARRGQRERRALSRLRFEVPDLTDVEYERVEQLAASEDIRRLADDALGGLSDEQADAIRLRVVGEKSFAEVADALGISEEAARARVSRGLRTLRRSVLPKGCAGDG